MKKIEVPPDMLAAARQAHRQNEDREPGVFLTEKILEAALLWLSNNPISPTPEQAMEIVRSRFDDRVTAVGFVTGAVEWQRRMFLAPEQPNPIVTNIKQTLLGSTLTAGDAVELMDAVRRCTSPAERS